MKFLNLGCGMHYTTSPEWTNVDFQKTGESVIAHNLLQGVPFENGSFDLVYHSHVLEHFSPAEGKKFMAECFRVLRPGGIIRVAVPDLERLAIDYLKSLNEAAADHSDEVKQANHEWMIVEMFDQFSRNHSGGTMLTYLQQGEMPNEDFVFERIGEEGRAIRQDLLSAKTKKFLNEKLLGGTKPSSIKARMSKYIRKYFLKKLNVNEYALRLGQFRLAGEIHQWMYDRYSLSNLLRRSGGKNIIRRDAFTSYIGNWASYNIDGRDNIVRKPDSLFLEAVK